MEEKLNFRAQLPLNCPLSTARWLRDSSLNAAAVRQSPTVLSGDGRRKPSPLDPANPSIVRSPLFPHNLRSQVLMLLRWWRYRYRPLQRSGLLAGSLTLLLPAFFPALFSPLRRAFPSIFSVSSLLFDFNSSGMLYAPQLRHLSLLNGALQHKQSIDKKSELWAPLAPQGWKPCIESSSTSSLPMTSNGFIQVFLDGGLNQQRMGICDAVAVAKILNATLIIPYLEVNLVCQYTSSFEEIFDIDHFIDTLIDDISVARGLPKEYSWSTREYYATSIRATRVKTASVHASADWYLKNVLPVLHRSVIIRLFHVA
ncbi:O-fucosyltransferase 31-like [Zingiber officinale]|uniref:O-fucosyltransferase 31-like n=1 Tax=Zingiber officinale TaxID=94328 RepID=UPI001C4AAA62|nr:O-fucosyltransferase 31-like [Zingiber officinale]